MLDVKKQAFRFEIYTTTEYDRRNNIVPALALSIRKNDDCLFFLHRVAFPAIKYIRSELSLLNDVSFSITSKVRIGYLSVNSLNSFGFNASTKNFGYTDEDYLGFL